MYFFVFNSFFYEPPNIHNLALVGLYSMMSAFLLSLNFNIWQFATKHICYSNIYTTYIAIYVTSQQRMVFEKKKQQKTNNDKTKRNNKKKKRAIYMVRGAKEIITKFGTENLYTNLQSERCDCAIKKEGLQTLFQLLRTRYPLSLASSFLFIFFFCKMAYRRISWNEVVHTSVHEIYTVTQGGIQDFSEEGKLITKTPPKQKKNNLLFFFLFVFKTSL